MKVLRILMMALASIGTAGCVYLVPAQPNSVQTVIGGSPDYLSYDLRTMAVYAGHVAALSENERAAECEKLLSGAEGEVGSLAIRLHTAFVMLLSPACGGPEKALSVLESIRDEVLEPELRNLVRYQIALANSLIASAEQYNILEQQNETLEASAEDLKKRLKAKDNELEQLKATLDALKQIEKSFHQRNEPGVP